MLKPKVLKIWCKLFNGDKYAALQYIMIERNVYKELAKENANAIKGLNPNITVWNTGEQSNQSSMKPISNIFQSLPPLLSTIQEQTGISPPNWLANASSSSYSKDEN
jgi:flotillin